MNNPALEGIQAREVKARQRMPQQALRVSCNVSQIWRFFGVSTPMFYIWEKCHEKDGFEVLRNLKALSPPPRGSDLQEEALPRPQAGCEKLKCCEEGYHDEGRPDLVLKGSIPVERGCELALPSAKGFSYFSHTLEIFPCSFRFARPDS